MASTTSPTAILAMLVDGKSRNATARALNIPRSQVDSVAVSHRDQHPVLRSKKPENRTAPPRHVPVPAWAHRAGLRADYYGHACLFGEHEAARHCRALKREATPTSDITGDTGGAR